MVIGLRQPYGAQNLSTHNYNDQCGFNQEASAEYYPVFRQGIEGNRRGNRPAANAGRLF